VIIYLNSINQLIFIMVKCCVFFEVRTEFVNDIRHKLRFQRASLIYCSRPGVLELSVHGTPDEVKKSLVPKEKETLKIRNSYLYYL
jgi:hypothetical protein